MWSTLIQRISPAKAALFPILLDTFAKSFVILLAAALAAIFMRRASAAARHLLWFLALLSLLLLPMSSAALPAWHVLPRLAWVNPPPAPPHPAPATPLAPEPSPISVAPYVPLTGQPESTPTSVRDDPQPHQSPPAVPSAPLPAIQPPPQALPRPAASPSLAFQAWLLLAWLAGCLLLLARIIGGLLSLSWLQRHSSRITRGPLFIMLAQLSAQLRIRRPPILLTSTRRSMPMTWGLFRPRLLLPAESAAWPADQLRTILLHELAHAKRCDCLTQLITQLALALYWCNPLAWLAASRIQTERERACDDVVLSAGFRPSQYASHLLDLVKTLRWPGPTALAVLAIAKPSHLEDRMRAILDSKRDRRAPRRLAILAATALTATLALLLSILHATPARPRDLTQAASTRPSSPGPGARTAAAQAQIDQLLKQLGADKWEDRQAAQEELVKMRDEVIPDLKRCLQTTHDEEVRARVEAALKEILAKPFPFRLPQGGEVRIVYGVGELDTGWQKIWLTPLPGPATGDSCFNNGKGRAQSPVEVAHQLERWPRYRTVVDCNREREDTFTVGRLARGIRWLLRYQNPIGTYDSVIYVKSQQLWVATMQSSPTTRPVSRFGDETDCLALYRRYRILFVTDSRQGGNTDFAWTLNAAGEIRDKDKRIEAAQLHEILSRGPVHSDYLTFTLALTEEDTTTLATLATAVGGIVNEGQRSLPAGTSVVLYLKSPVLVAAPATRPAVLQAQIDLLLKQLGAQKQEDRQAAQDELVKLGDDAILDLWQLFETTTDAEVRTRAQTTLKDILTSPSDKVVARIRELGGKVELDDSLPARRIIRVDLSGTEAEDADLKNIAGLQSHARLLELDLSRCKHVTDAGLLQLKGLTDLSALYLPDTTVTDAGLEKLKALTKLKKLGVGGTNITDTGLGYLTGMTSLQDFDLGRTTITDASLECFKGLPELKNLNLAYTQVTDAGLQRLDGCKSLKYLTLRGTKVTVAGVNRLQRQLPGLTVSWDGREP